MVANCQIMVATIHREKEVINMVGGLPVEELDEKLEVLAKLVSEEPKACNDAACHMVLMDTESVTDADGYQTPKAKFTIGGSCPDGLSWDDDDDDDITDLAAAGQKWSDLSACRRIHRVLVQWIGKFVALVALLYLFICSLDFLSSAFRILGGKTAGGVFANSEVLRNPLAGLMIGLLATVLVQSSSTSTSIAVTMVGSGILDVSQAIPMIMGANIGTSVTNTFVSMAQSGNRREFRRAFAAATVHDMFNWLTVLVLLPLEVTTGYLYRVTKAITEGLKLEDGAGSKGGNTELLKALTKPFTSLVVQVDKKVISKIAEGDESYLNKSLIKKYCKYEEIALMKNITTEMNMTTIVNGTTVYKMVNVTQEVEVTEKVPFEKCFSALSRLDINENLAGVLLLIFSLVLLCTCLILMVKLLNSLLKGSIAKVIKKTINADFPGCFSWLTGYVAMLVGALMTILVQSSSVLTSALTPLVGVGMIKIERMYPLTLGSNLGTTGTGILAALAAPGDSLHVAVQIALCHLFFNLSGILLFYPVPVMRQIPIKLAKCLGTITAKYRWFAVFYIIVMFLVFPVSIFLLSLAGSTPSIIVYSILAPFLLFIIVLNIMQRKCSKCLPKVLQSWDFLPKVLRSLEPVDKVVTKVVGAIQKLCPFCGKCCEPKKSQNPQILIQKAGLMPIIPVSHIVKRPSPSQSVASSVMLLSPSRH